MSTATRAQVVARANAATSCEAIREQADRPSTLMTDWLNLYTPVGREYVGHHRVDHERKSTSVTAGSRPTPVGGFSERTVRCCS